VTALSDYTAPHAFIPRRHLVLINASVSTQGQTDFQIGPVAARPGTVATGRLEIAPGADGSTFIPISIARNARSGPTLARIAGVHGAETSPFASPPANAGDTVAVIAVPSPRKD
jgi:hypothetical protein